MCVSGEWGEGGELYPEERLGEEAGVRSACLGSHVWGFHSILRAMPGDWGEVRTCLIHPILSLPVLFPLGDDRLQSLCDAFKH